MRITFASGPSDLRGLAADLNRASGQVGARAARVLRSGAARIEADAKTAAPVDTGNLQASIGTTITGDGRHGSMTAEIGPTAHYGAYVELGTSKMAPQPYLIPAMERNEDSIIQALANCLTEGL